MSRISLALWEALRGLLLVLSIMLLIFLLVSLTSVTMKLAFTDFQRSVHATYGAHLVPIKVTRVWRMSWDSMLFPLMPKECRILHSFHCNPACRISGKIVNSFFLKIPFAVKAIQLCGHTGGLAEFGPLSLNCFFPSVSWCFTFKYSGNHNKWHARKVDMPRDFVFLSG